MRALLIEFSYGKVYWQIKSLSIHLVITDITSK